MTIYTLTKDGKEACATIVIAKRPTPAAAFAAKELQYHIKKISGAVLPVITDDPTAIQHAQKNGKLPLILIGDSDATKQVVGEINFEPQEYMVALIRPQKRRRKDTDPEPEVDTIVLLGRDAGLRDFESFDLPAGRGHAWLRQRMPLHR